MSAQPGGAILLGYGAQPAAAQSGAALLLEYVAAGPVRTTLRSGVVAQWANAVASRTTVVARTSTTSNADARVNAPWGNANPSSTAARSSWSVASAVDRAARAPWGAFTVPVTSPTTSAWGISRNADRKARVPWGMFGEIAAVAGRSEWGLSTPADTSASLPWGAFRPMAHTVAAIIRRAHHIAPHWVLPWNKFSRTLRPGWGIIIPDGEPPRDENGTILVPILESYIVLNEVSIARVSDGANIPALSISITADAQSWTFGFDATLPLQAQSMVEPTSGPVELIASINGEMFHLIVESISRERAFGQASVRISGRGRNAVLDAPYSAVMTFENAISRTANQLADDALLANGVNVGQATIGEPWVVDWNLTDWLVPAGVWIHNGTHISALNTIAQAAGGYLQPHPTDPVVKILPGYPVAPWDWGDVTPDFELPASVTTRESIQWVDKPAYNRVFVSGQQVGVIGQVTRAGSAGDVVASPVVDPLITHADAARQRGIRILGDTGRIATVGLSLPVLEDTGVIPVGSFVRYVDGPAVKIGLVRANATSAGAFGVDLTQSLTLEVHE